MERSVMAYQLVAPPSQKHPKGFSKTIVEPNYGGCYYKRIGKPCIHGLNKDGAKFGPTRRCGQGGTEANAKHNIKIAEIYHWKQFRNDHSEFSSELKMNLIQSLNTAAPCIFVHDCSAHIKGRETSQPLGPVSTTVFWNELIESTEIQN